MKDKVWETMMIVLGFIVVMMVLAIIFVQSFHQTIDCKKVFEMASKDKSYMPAYENCVEERKKNEQL